MLVDAQPSGESDGTIGLVRLYTGQFRLEVINVVVINLPVDMTFV